MEILELHPEAGHGLRLGSRLVVPNGVAGVVAKDGKALDALPPGDCFLEAPLFPRTLQALKVKSGMALPSKPLPAALFLVQARTAWTVPWQCLAILSKNPAHGLTYTILTGSVQPLNIPPEQATVATEAIRTAAGQAAASWPASAGLHCTAFDLDSVAPVRRPPCVICKFPAAPPGYALFQRNISLFYVRYAARKEGNFCVPCAWKTSAAFNAVMLAAGWWGLIGLILTPAYFFSNLYYLSRVLGSAKAASSAN